MQLAYEDHSKEELGFGRKEFGSIPLAGETHPPSTHVFVVYKKRDQWPADLFEAPSNAEADAAAAAANNNNNNNNDGVEKNDGSTFNNLVKSVDEGMKAAKKHKHKQFSEMFGSKCKVFALEVNEDLDDQEGDIILMPQMVKIRHSATTIQEANEFATRFLDHELDGNKKSLQGPQIFICAHIARDARCGHCGPVVMQSLKNVQNNKCTFRFCSHVGGHKFAANLISFKPVEDGHVIGDWLGYVSPEAAPELIEYFQDKSSKSFPPLKMWRGRVGATPDEHISLCEECKCQSEDVNIPRVLFVLGGPGAGKGTQCSNLVKTSNVVHLSAGDLLREAQEDPTSKDGALIKEYIKEGKIVPVEITVNLLLNAMKKSGASNFLIDGFPRNQDNLDGWNRVVGNKADVRGVLFFDVPEAIMEARLLERGKSSGRADDNIESIKKRFRTYVESTKPIIDEFGRRGKLLSVRGDFPVEEVFKEVCASIPRVLPELKIDPSKLLVARRPEPLISTNVVPSAASVSGNRLKQVAPLLLLGGLVGAAFIFQRQYFSKR